MANLPMYWKSAAPPFLGSQTSGIFQSIAAPTVAGQEMEALVSDINQGGRLRAVLRVEGDGRRLSPDLELAAYRISQEAVQNAVRHAAATELTVTVAFAPDSVVLCIADNGIGFEPPANPADLTRAGHFGLMGIRERALLLGGRLEINGKPGSGTLLTIHLPDKP